jgi:catechol 2,3-dioxygenase-like lactoylglutathione lyase family enzyme
MEHMLVLTDEIGRSREFYCDALGLEVGERPPLEFPGDWLYLDGVPCVHLAEREPFESHSESLGIPASPRSERTGAVDHIAFAGEDYDEVLGRLEQNGVKASKNTVPGIGMRQLFCEDPNGVKIEINVMPAEGT